MRSTRPTSMRFGSNHFPRVAATNNELASAEQHLGVGLDPSYRDFLGHANGWPSFMQSVDLLGTDDLADGPRLAAEQSAYRSHCRITIGYSRQQRARYALAQRDQATPRKLRSASRITALVVVASASARCSIAFRSSGSMRTGTTSAGPEPIAGRPGLRLFLSASMS